jgi:hippurate hydrolase
MRSYDDIEAMVPALAAIRRDIHAHPELAYEEFRTAALVADELKSLGLEVTTGIGGTGVVGTLRRGDSPRSLGFRADMDALGFQEETGLAHASRTSGVFHGCGHDGHTAILLGAARYLAKAGSFCGVIHFIFQPAEEGRGGAREMLRDGLFERFDCDSVFALHNWPDLPAGSIQTRPGPIMAAADKFEILVTGKGGHAAQPDQSPDAILAAAALVMQLNTIVSRRVPATEQAVLSVTMIEGGKTHNVIPSEVRLMGTVRTFDPGIQDMIEAGIREIAAGTALSTQTQIEVKYTRYYPATINDPECAVIALEVAASVCGDASEAPDPAFTSEDFAFMLQQRPGAYIWLGQNAGDGAPLHNPRYDFNDEVIGTGVAWFVELAGRLLPES